MTSRLDSTLKQQMLARLKVKQRAHASSLTEVVDSIHEYGAIRERYHRADGEAENIYLELLLVHGAPPNLMSAAFQDWNNVAHRWMLDRGIGDDAIARKDIIDYYIVWLAFRQMEAGHEY